MEKQQVLIIEDDKDTAGFFDLVFNLLGFSCKRVGNVEDAFITLENTLPDLILLDLRLNSATGGEEILYKVRGDARFDDTRIVIVTAYPVMARPISDLADLVLVKPVDVNQLKALTSRLLGVEIRPKRFFYRDPLTELFNRDFFETRLEHAYERSRRRTDFHYAVLVVQTRVDQDESQVVGRQQLKPFFREVAARLRRGFRPTDTLAYLDDGRFAGLYEELRDPNDVDVLIDRMNKLFTDPFEVGSRRYQPDFWIGAALSKVEYSRPEDIIDAALRSMTQLEPAGKCVPPTSPA